MLESHLKNLTVACDGDLDGEFEGSVFHDGEFDGKVDGEVDGPSTSPSHRKLNIIPVKGPKQCVGGWETNVPDTSNSSHGTAAHDNRSG